METSCFSLHFVDCLQIYKWWKQNYAKGVAKPGQGGVQKRATVTNNARIGRVQSMVLAMESFQEKPVSAISNAHCKISV